MSEQWTRKQKVPTWHKVKKVNPNAKRRNLIVQVVEVNPVEGKTFAEVIVGDDTALITARLAEDQLSLAKPGAFLRMQNARISMFQSHLRVECDKWSKLAPHDKQTWEVNKKESNISDVEYELVGQK